MDAQILHIYYEFTFFTSRKERTADDSAVNVQGLQKIRVFKWPKHVNFLQ
jgi:hypothetical protein